VELPYLTADVPGIGRALRTIDEDFFVDASRRTCPRRWRITSHPHRERGLTRRSRGLGAIIARALASTSAIIGIAA